MPEQQRWFNREFFRNPIQSGDAGGGFLGGLERFLRGTARETVSNTAREIVTGGAVNPARGIGSGLRDAVRGTNWYHDRQDRQGNLGPPSSLAGPGAAPPARNEGFLGRLDNSFSSGTNPLAAALGAFTGYGQYGTANAATSAYNDQSLRMANAPVSRGNGGGAQSGQTNNGGNSAASYGTGGNATSSRWLPIQTGTRLVRRT